MQRKKGISLIVLVITIIVMIILAATIILAINNNNIVDKAKDAVTETNLKQVQELAQTLWADAYIEGARTQEELETAVIEGLKDVDISKYVITVTTSGVDVSVKGGEKNDYGFYFDKLYLATMVEDEQTIKVGYVFHENSAELYFAGSETNNILICEYADEISYDNMDGISVSSDGKTITLDGDTFTLTSQEIQGLYYNREYTATVDGTTVTAILGSNNALKIITTTSTGEVTETTKVVQVKGNGHFIKDSTGTTVLGTVSIDGKYLFCEAGILELTEKTAENPEVAMWYDGWEAAYAYDGTSWTDKILATDIENIESITVEQSEELGYSVVAKFYKLDSTVTETTLNGKTFPAGNAYKMVISGEGEMGVLCGTNFSSLEAWVKDVINYFQGNTTELPLIVYATEITVEEGINNIPQYALAYTLNANKVTLPGTISSIEFFAFSALKGEVIVSENNSNYCSIDGILYDKGVTTVVACPTSKTKVVLPNTITDVGAAFIFNNGITELVLPEGVTKLVGDDFIDCSKLHTITLPKTLQSIGGYAFDGCTSLTTVNYRGTEEEWKNITITEDGNELLTNATKVYNYTAE